MARILTWLMATPIGRRFAGLAGGLLALLLMAWRIFLAGRRNAENKNLKKTMEGVRQRHEVDETIAGRAAADNRQRLRRWSRD